LKEQHGKVKDPSHLFAELVMGIEWYW